MANSFYIRSQMVQGRYMYLTCTQVPDIATNSSVINWTLTVTGGSANYYTTGETQVIIGGNLVYYKERVSYSTYQFPAAKGSVSGSVTIKHNDDGTLTIPVTIYTMIYNGVFQTNTDNWELDKLDRYASITEAPNFTDEQNPVIKYSNPAADKVESLQACISVDGSKADIAYRDISKTGSSYTFTLTAAEKNVLYSATTGTSRTVKFIVKTVIGGATFTSALERTFSIVNAAPQLSALVMDTNTTTTALTGDSLVYLIKGYSNAAYELSATALKAATIASYSATNGSTNKTTSSGTFTKVNESNFSFVVKDSRGLSTTKSIKLSLINYFKPTVKAEVALALDTDTTYKAAITISGTFFNGSFGAKSNSLTLQIKHSKSSNWVAVTATKSGNSFNATYTVSAIDYTTNFTYQIRVIDALETITSAEETVSYNPLFDWGEDSFNFNVPIAMNGDITLRHTDENKVVLSADKADIYLRPNGTSTDSGQLRLSTDGTATLNGKKIATIDMIYPVGSIYISVNTTSPATYFGGTWQRITDRFLLAAGSTYANGATGGSATHTLTVDEMPSHRHSAQYATTGGYKSGNLSQSNYAASSTVSMYGNIFTDYEGGGKAHNNMPPYLVVYMWKRTA